MSYPALLHDPVSGTTKPVTITWDARFHGNLRIEDSSGVVRDIAATDLTLTQGGWRGDGLNFAWQHEGQTWAVTVGDPRAVADLAKELPSNLASHVVNWQKQNKRRSRWSATALIIGALFTLLPLFILIALFMMRDRILDIIIDKMPKRIDAEIGQMLHEQLVGSGTLVKDGPSVEAVRAASQRFAPHLPEDFNFRFEVVNDSSVNAFATPGGLIVVQTGLLAKATSVDELVGVLGHEITHVTQRHSLRQIIYGLGLTNSLYWLLGVPDGVAGTLAVAAADLSGLKFSREQETEADRGGVELLRKARLPASGLQSFLDKLAQEQGTVPSFLSTHPADDERSAMLQEAIAERGEWDVEPLVIDWDAVRQDAQARMEGK